MVTLKDLLMVDSVVIIGYPQDPKFQCDSDEMHSVYVSKS